MVILSQQGRLGFPGGDFHGRLPKYQTKRHSSIALTIIIVAHGLFIFIALSAKIKQRENLSVQPLLQLIQLQSEKKFTSELEKPDVSFESNAIHIQVPELNLAETLLVKPDLSSYDSLTPYELPNSTDTTHGNVFDPKLRQKLLDAERLNKPRAADKPKSWTEADGRTFVDMGNGRCLVSMPKVDSRDRGTNLGFTRCGKTDSEKMMDSVMADFESRKNPLKQQ